MSQSKALGNVFKLRGFAFVDDPTFGAKGDGVTDDTTAIQAAFNSGAKIVSFTQGKSYLVSEVGTKTFRSAAQRYCVLIPDGVTAEGNGATVKLAAAANAALFMNSTPGTTQNTDICVRNFVIDGNRTNQTSPAAGDMPCLHFYDVLRLRVENIRVKDARQYFGRFLLIDNGYFNNLNGKTSDGDGWSFGVSGTYNVSNSFIDNIYGEACSASYGGGLVGNGFIATLYYSSVGKVETINCGGGIKLQGPANDCTAGQLIYRGGANSTTNSGVKIQGQGGLQDVARISIGQIISENAQGQAFYTLESIDVNVGSILSFQDGLAASTAAVTIETTAKNTQLGSVEIKKAGQGGLSIEGVNTSVASAIVSNSGQLATGQSNIGIRAGADGVRIGYALSVDDQTGAHTANRGLNLASGCKNINIDFYHSRGDYAVVGNHLVDSGAASIRIGKYQIDDNDLYVRLANTTQAGNDAASALEKTLQSVTVKARSLWLNGYGYKISAWGLTANNTNPKSIKVYFGSAILTTPLTVSQSSFWRAECMVMRTSASNQAYSSLNVQPGTANIFDMERGGLTETDTADIIVKTTATVTDGGGGINANDLICYGLVVEPIE